jgi:hypothetical protein
MKEVFAFTVTVRNTDWSDVINARNEKQARAYYHARVSDVWPHIKLKDVSAHKIGAPYTSEGFERNAKYRGLPHAKCGMRVRVGNAEGVIVGHNSSANFDILFDDDSPLYPGERLNVHPHELEILNAKEAA